MADDDGNNTNNGNNTKTKDDTNNGNKTKTKDDDYEECQSDPGTSGGLAWMPSSSPTLHSWLA